MHGSTPTKERARTASAHQHLGPKWMVRSGGQTCAAEAVHWSMEIHPRFPAELGGLELASGIRVISGLPEEWARTLCNQVGGGGRRYSGVDGGALGASQLL